MTYQQRHRNNRSFTIVTVYAMECLYMCKAFIWISAMHSFWCVLIHIFLRLSLFIVCSKMATCLNGNNKNKIRPLNVFAEMSPFTFDSNNFILVTTAVSFGMCVCAFSVIVKLDGRVSANWLSGYMVQLCALMCGRYVQFCFSVSVCRYFVENQRTA